METFIEDWRKNEDIDKLRDKEKLEILEKFYSRIKDVVKAYELEEGLENIIDDLNYEIDSVEVELWWNTFTNI